MARERPPSPASIPPDQTTDAGEQANQADDAPEHGAGGRTVGDQRFMRPVVGVGGPDPGRSVLRPRTSTRRRRRALSALPQSVSAPLESRTPCGLREDIGVVGAKLRKAQRGPRNRYAVASCFVGVGADLANEARFEHRLLIQIEAAKFAAPA